MDWYPLKLSTPIRKYAFGGRLIPEKLGKFSRLEGIIAESWEVSDHKSTNATVVNGSLEGAPFRELIRRYPAEIVGRKWHGPHFPLLLKFLDASHTLPVHLHADDETAVEHYGEPHGKTEAWHIIRTPEESSVLLGVRPELSDEELFAAFKAQAYDDVMTRVPIKPGDTVYVPAGTLHTFGPDTLVFEVQQTSDLTQSVMPTDVYGTQLPEEAWEKNIYRTISELRQDFHPMPFAGLAIEEVGKTRLIGCAGPHFALDRWYFKDAITVHSDSRRFTTLSNVGDPVRIEFPGGAEKLDRAESCLLPAAMEEVNITPEGVGDIIACYVPELETDVVEPLTNAGYSMSEIRRLGDVNH
jgi:mannose-6-phosphate isomerase